LFFFINVLIVVIVISQIFGGAKRSRQITQKILFFKKKELFLRVGDEAFEI
jgi:hypothetical protein